MGTSCTFCKYMRRLDERYLSFPFICENDKAKSGLIQGTGRILLLKDRELPPEAIVSEGPRMDIDDNRLYMTHPDYISCEHFSPIEDEPVVADDLSNE